MQEADDFGRKKKNYIAARLQVKAKQWQSSIQYSGQLETPDVGP